MIYLVSNYANDILEYSNNQVVKWWPALYIEKFFIENNIEYDLIAWTGTWEVSISKNNWEDVWLIKYAPEINVNDEIKWDFFIISTLLNEFDLKKTSKLDWLVFCDIQWYIRELNSTRRKLINDLEWIENIDFLKVADYEFQFLTNNLINRYIDWWWIIIVTAWSKWIVKLIKNSWESIINVPIWDFKDTLWAWDTFIVSFAYNFYKTKNIELSIIKSSNYVYNFLKEKNNNF